jgi:hypothetical protein
MWIERNIAQTLMLALVILLVACGGGGPSDDEVSQACLKAFPATHAYDGIKVSEKVKSDQGGYLVTVYYDTLGGSGLADPPGHYTLRIAMAKSGKAWIITKMDLLGMEPLPKDLQEKVEEERRKEEERKEEERRKEKKRKEDAMTPQEKKEQMVREVSSLMGGFGLDIEVYELEHKSYPPWSLDAGKNAFSIVKDSKNELLKVPTFLELPYKDDNDFKSLPQDPFSPVKGVTFAYWSTPHTSTTVTKSGNYILWSPGPDGVYDLTIDRINQADDMGALLAEVTYDPTNGTECKGDLVETNGGEWPATKANMKKAPLVPTPMADLSVPTEQYGALADAKQLATLYHALSGKPANYEELAPVFSKDYENSTDAFQKKDLLNALKPEIDQKIAFFGEQKNHYFKIELQGYLSHYDFSDKSFPVKLPNTEPNYYIFFDNFQNYMMGFTNGEKFTKAYVPEEEKARRVEARISESARSGSLPVQAVVFVFAQGTEPEDKRIHSQIVKVQLYARNDKQSEMILEY